MQFDHRIKELILQGETSLIVEIIKQLYDRDEKKNHEEMMRIPIMQKNKAGRTSKHDGKAVDLKRMNLQKDPEES